MIQQCREQKDDTAVTLRHRHILYTLSSHHQGLVHVVLAPGAAIVIFRVHGEAEEENVDHVLKDGEEAVSHQEGKQTDDEERQDPHGVFPLVVQSQDAGKSCAGDYEHLKGRRG